MSINTFHIYWTAIAISVLTVTQTVIHAGESNGGQKPQKQEAEAPPFQTWDIFWADYKANLVVNRGLANVEVPGEVNVIVTLPNDLSNSEPIVKVKAGSTPIRELNVVVRPVNRMQPITLSGHFTNAVIAQVASERNSRAIKTLQDPLTLKAGTAVLEEGVRPQQVNIITQIKYLRDQRQRH